MNTGRYAGNYIKAMRQARVAAKAFNRVRSNLPVALKRSSVSPSSVSPKDFPTAPTHTVPPKASFPNKPLQKTSAPAAPQYSFAQKTLQIKDFPTPPKHTVNPEDVVIKALQKRCLPAGAELLNHIDMRRDFLTQPLIRKAVATIRQAKGTPQDYHIRKALFDTPLDGQKNGLTLAKLMTSPGYNRLARLGEKNPDHRDYLLLKHALTGYQKTEAALLERRIRALTPGGSR